MKREAVLGDPQPRGTWVGLPLEDQPHAGVPEGVVVSQ